jgi:hypothetical protein
MDQTIDEVGEQIGRDQGNHLPIGTDRLRPDPVEEIALQGDIEDRYRQGKDSVPSLGSVEFHGGIELFLFV